MTQYSKIMFDESIKSERTRETYTWYLQKFVDYFKLKIFDSVLKIPKEELQKMVATYVIHTKKRVNPNSVPSFCKPIKLFLEVNDIDLNWKKISRLYPERIKESGNSAWQTEDVQKMLDSTVQLKNKAIIHFLASTGVRVGSMTKLKLRHLRDMPDGCKMVLIYEDSKEEYQTFLTPESSTALDSYLDERKQEGEVFHNDSILFRAHYTLISQSSRPMTTKAIQSVVTRAIKNSAIRGQKKNGRYATQGVHGFRKRFNTILKLNNSVNDNAIEKMMGHRHGLDGSYFQGTIEQLFEEFRKGIPELTVDGTARKQAELEAERMKKDELQLKLDHQRDTVREQVADILNEKLNEMRATGYLPK